MSNKISITAIIVSLLSLCCSAVCLVNVMKADRGTAQSEPPAAVQTESAVQTDDSSVKQYVMYVGTNDKDTYKPEHTQEEAHEIVDKVCLKYFPDGYTLQEATGAWTDDKNNITHEYTLVCYFDGADAETVHKAADDVIAALNQNSVLIEQDNINIEFYSGK